ncbi:MAG TPA: putative Ig domain-containing protein [Verrucomicrobiae bacterium]|jgi:hypothetical protein|nr:putative Ig domain-containing protein [Verrucomicrobiae bacterium]
MSPKFHLPAQPPAQERTSTRKIQPAAYTFSRALFFILMGLLLATQSVFASSSDSKKSQLTITGNIPVGVATESYSASVKGSGGTAPYDYKVSNLPKGLKISNSSGAIAGTCATVGTFSFTVYVTDAAGDYGNATFSVTFDQPPVTISLSPGTVTVQSQGTQQFLADVQNTNNTNVTWTTTLGTISSTGSFTAPKVTGNTKVTITATSVADSTKKASSTVTVSNTTNPPVALELLFPPTSPYEDYYSDVQTYLTNNSLIAGVTMWVQWSSADAGPGSNPQYDFSTYDAQIAPWIAAGKKVNIVVWAVSDMPTNTATPQYVLNNLGSSNITTCAGEKIPNYFSSAFQLPYEAFMAQVIKHYASNGSVGYIRMGLGRGGETFPAPNFGTDSCTSVFENKWGWTTTTWTNYVDAMLNYEATLKSPKQLMVGLDSIDTYSMAEAEAATAISLKIAIGNEGMQMTDMTNYPHCSADWCDLFDEYTGDVPLELQTIAVSSPENDPPVGSLVNLLPFAVSHHATILEIYTDDWLLAFDPNYPGNATYGAAYQETFKSVAEGK